MTDVRRRLSSLSVVTVFFAVAASPVAAQCKSPMVSVLPMSALIAQGGYLAGDGRGAYVDGTQGSVVTLGNGSGAANLMTSQGVPLNAKSRFIAFNFNSPIVESGAVSLGVIQERQSEVHVHYHLGPVEADGLRQIHSVQEVPDDGVFYTSDRTGLFVRINGVGHKLIFGGDTWPLNFCNPDSGAVLAVSGTTKLQIARQGETYTLQAPPGSIGRLYDNSDPFALVDKGLYRFSFLITLSPIVKKNGR